MINIGLNIEILSNEERVSTIESLSIWRIETWKIMKRMGSRRWIMKVCFNIRKVATFVQCFPTNSGRRNGALHVELFATIWYIHHIGQERWIKF